MGAMGDLDPNPLAQKTGFESRKKCFLQLFSLIVSQQQKTQLPSVFACHKETSF